MRVSTSQLYDRGIQAILDGQRGLADTQQQLASGKKINRPSDDPVGTSQLVRINEDLDKIDQYRRNNDLLTSSLEEQEAILRNITDSVNRARVLTIQGGSGLLNDEDRRAIATEIEQIRNEVFDLMNSQNAGGDYIFGGHQSQIQPFAYNPGAAGNAFTYQGDSGTNDIKLSDSVTVRGTSSGFDVFENVEARLNFSVTGSTGLTIDDALLTQQGTFNTFHEANYDGVTAANNDYRITITAANQVEVRNVGTGALVDTLAFSSGEPFNFRGIDFTLTGGVGDTADFSLDQPEKKNLAQTLDDLFRALSDSSISDGDYREALADALVGIDNGLTSMQLETSSIGGRLNVAESIEATNLDLEIANKSARSAIEDVDYAAASAEFAKQETALSAALATFPQVTNLSLFNFI